MSICMCSTLVECNKKNECYRFCKEPHPYNQPWADMYKEDFPSITLKSSIGICSNFIPIQKGDILRK